ncbi:PAS domain-containing protein [Marinoscillum sp.]|uniref:sensor histidine kinase n=1 Tax=Marinoscillum sp. TaxID=2024838 RepID=UPI003BABE74D
MEELTTEIDFWSKLIHPDDYDRILAENADRKVNDRYIREYRILHKQNHWVWIKEYCIDVQEVKGSIIITGIAFDISKEKEDQLRLDLALKSSQMGVFEYRPQSDLFITSDVVVNSLGYESRKELPDTLTELLQKVVHPEDMHLAMKYKNESDRLQLGEIQKGFYRMQHKDGHTIYLDFFYVAADVDEKQQPIKIIGTLKDITEQKIQELDLAHTNQSLQKIIESVPGVVFRCPKNSPDKADFISEQIEGLTGYRMDEFKPQGTINYLDLIYPADLKRLFETIESALEDNHFYEVTYRLRHKSGRDVWVWERGNFISMDGEVYIEGFMTDITDTVKAEDRLLSATLRAEDTERTRISREIHDGVQQTLVSSLFSFQEFLVRMNGEMDEKSELLFTRALETLQAGVSETRMIAHSIMPKSISDFGLIDTLDQMFANLSDTTSSRFSFYHNIPEDSINDAIATSLYRICQEASNNIMKYAKATEVEVQLMKHDNSLILSIDDNGCGFDARSKDIYFSGLGISSMKSRANAISGTFDLSSKPGKGTSIMVEVPLN